jgi:hypothetical protein
MARTIRMSCADNSGQETPDCRPRHDPLFLKVEAPVAQLDRALPSEGKGHTFESCRVRHDISKPLKYIFIFSKIADFFADLVA